MKDFMAKSKNKKEISALLVVLLLTCSAPVAYAADNSGGINTTVTIGNSSNNKAYVGGSGTTIYTTNGTVIINAGMNGYVMGGYSSNENAATSNTVTMNSGTVTMDIYGGRSGTVRSYRQHRDHDGWLGADQRDRRLFYWVSGNQQQPGVDLRWHRGVQQRYSRL